MDTNNANQTPSYTPPQQSQPQTNQPMTSGPITPPVENHRIGKVALITTIVAVILLVIAYFAWGLNDDWAKENTYSNAPEATASESQQDDLSSIEAELEATQFEGASESL